MSLCYPKVEKLWMGSPRWDSTLGRSPQDPFPFLKGQPVLYYSLTGEVFPAVVVKAGVPVGHTRTGRTIRWGYRIAIDPSIPGRRLRLVADRMLAARTDA